MSAIAGRVLLIPKGNYDSTATYTMLDMVVYNGSSYICKQECTGVVPTNTTYWMLNASGSAVAYINDIGDVVITNPTNGQVLMYDSATQKWVNGTLSTTLAGLTDTQIASLQNGQVLKYNATSQKWENAEDTGGLLPHLIIISETGESVVKAVKGTTEIIATETSTGHYECDVPEFGTWTIHAVLNGEDATVNLVVDTVKVYTVDDSHFHGTVTVKYPSGATCRLQSADETLYATGSPYTFTVHHAETYTITVTYNQRIYTDTVTFTTEGQSFSKTLPSPSEVDANDINWWLFFGGVSGTFSSLDEILANSTALSLLMASTDAVDYLVRCTDWASNEGLVPIMTSNTTPSGVASASSIYSSARDAYTAFNGTDKWMPSGNTFPQWIQYKFDNAVCVKLAKAKYVNDSGSSYTMTVNISASNDGTNFTDLATNVPLNNDSSYTSIALNNDTTYLYYRMTVVSGDVGIATGSGYGLQFYPHNVDPITDNQSAMSYIGLNNYCANTLLADADWRDGICNSEYFESVLNVKVPVMTSNTTPSGVVSANSESSASPAYKCFDGDNTTSGAKNTSTTTGWVQYNFGRPVKIFRTEFYINYGTAPSTHTNKIQHSDDGTTFTDDVTGIAITNGQNKITVFNSSSAHSIWRIDITTSPAKQNLANEIQFYGREDV